MLVKKKLLLGSVFLLLFTGIAGCADLNHKYHKEDNNMPPSNGRPHGNMPPEVADKLGFNSTETDLVLSVNRNGEVQAFVRDGVNFTQRNLPIHAGNILAIESITVFRTSNPKICITLGGTEYCSGSD